MSRILIGRGAQCPLVNMVEFDITDRIKDTMGKFQEANQTSLVLPVIELPEAAVLYGDSFLEVVTPSNDTGTHTLALGVDGAPTQYLEATNIKSAARTPITVTTPPNGKPIIATLAAASGDATLGKVRIVFAYVLPGRQTENAVG